MDIDAVGFVRPPIRGEAVTPLEIEGSTRLLTRSGGPGIELRDLHNAGTSVSDLYQASVDSLVELCVSGFNVSLLIVGESGSGKSYVLAGNNSRGTGLVPLILENLFSKVQQDERLQFNPAQGTLPEVTLQMYEIYNELVIDLQQIPGLSNKYCSIEETARDGTVIKNGKQSEIKSATEGESIFRQAWPRRVDQYMDYGPAKNYTSVIIYIDVVVYARESPLPNKSRFSIILTPGAEKLAEDPRQLRMRQGPTLSKSMVALNELVTALADHPYADRVINYNESILTSLVKDDVGGNSKTRVIFCLKPHNEPSFFEPIHRFVYQCTQVKNFPVLNDPFAQQLLTQYRAAIKHLKQQVGWSAGLSQESNLQDIHEEFGRIQTENVTLRDQNDRLHQRLDHLQNKFGTLASTKTDLSSQLLFTEEEKLKVSKAMVEMQIENNKLKEEGEATKFELTNKILKLESDLMQLELERDVNSKLAAAANKRLETLTKDRKEIADEYVALKANYSSLKEAHTEEVRKNEELSVELLNLVNAKAALMKRLDKVETSSSRFNEPDAELERVRAIVSRMSTRRKSISVMEQDRFYDRPGDIEASEEKRARTERDLFGSQEKFEEDMENLKRQNEDHVRKLEDRIAFMKKEMYDYRNLAQERQRKVSQMNARIITLNSEVAHLKNQNNKLQHKFKHVNDEFRLRLSKYIEDIANYIEGRGDNTGPPGIQEMRNYVEGMLSDMRKAHRVREEQLAQAAQDYRNRLKQVTRTHEQLITSYRELRLQYRSQTGNGPDLVPDEYELKLSDPEFMSSHQKEIDQLREQLDHAHQQMEALKFGLKTSDTQKRVDKRPLLEREKSWSELRRQMREWTQTTQQDLEQERARLITVNTVLEEEKKRLQTYIDTHLKKYKEEARRLRQMLGITDSGSLDSPDPMGRRSQPHHR